MYCSWLTDTVTPDLDRALHYTLFWGFETVELRTVGGLNSRVPHVNVEKVQRRLREHEVRVAAVVPALFEGAVEDNVTWYNEIASLPETVRFCKQVGTSLIVASSFPRSASADVPVAAKALKRAGEVAARAGVQIAVLNEIGGVCPRGQDLAALLEAVNHPAVGAAWDPLTALHAGEDPRIGTEALSGYIRHVRCRDGATDGQVVATLGDGDVPWEDIAEMLQRQGYEGAFSLVVEGDPTDGLHSATTLIRAVRSATRV